MIYSYINTRGNWENSKFCENTLRRVSTQFLVFPIPTRVDKTVYKHGKCFIFVNYRRKDYSILIGYYFSICTLCNYCSAINKRRAEPGKEAGKINMAADIANCNLTANISIVLEIYRNSLRFFKMTWTKYDCATPQRRALAPSIKAFVKAKQHKLINT